MHIHVFESLQLEGLYAGDLLYCGKRHFGKGMWIREVLSLFV